jgi:hypothetical protein
LQTSVRLRLLHLGPHGYALRGMAKKLARPQNDASLAMVQEVAGLHHKLIAGTLPKIRSGELWTLGDQDGELIARSSRSSKNSRPKSLSAPSQLTARCACSRSVAVRASICDTQPTGILRSPHWASSFSRTSLN